MRFILLVLGLIMFAGCSKQNINTSDVIYGLAATPASVEADGSGVITVTVMINKDADVSERKVTFGASSGSFTGSGTNTITVEGIYEDSKLIASAVLKAPSAPGTVVITAQPALTNPYHDFIVKDSVIATPSIPASVHLEASAFSVSTGFLGEIELTATLKNNKKRNVSTGNAVVFYDYLVGGRPLNGRFRDIQATSNENSQVSTFYSPGNVSPGTDFYIQCTVLDNGLKTSIKDSVLISVVP